MIHKVDINDEQLIADICELAKIIWTEHYSPIIGIDQVNYMLDNFQSSEVIKNQIDHGYLYDAVFDADAKLIGYQSYQIRDKELFVSKIYLLKEQRGKGYFSKMLERIQSFASLNNISTLTLTVNKYNKRSIDIYKHKGFVIESEAVFDIGKGYVMDDYILRKTIS